MSAPALTDQHETESQESSSKEQRKSRRHEYVCRQLVAPFDGERMPQQEEFSWAHFRDVSTSGVSFLIKKKFKEKLLVVAVGPAPFSFLIVEVVRCTRRNDLPGQPYLVGCNVVRELTD